MALHDILKMGDPRLLRQAELVGQFDTPELHALIADLFETMYAVNGAGLAAPQIGENLQVVIFGFKKNVRYPDAPEVPETVLINPVLTPLSDEQEDGWEGCLSVPGLRGVVPRYSKLHYKGYDQYGNVIERTVDGFHARVVQHECDHLIGVLYPMRIKDFTQFGFTEILFPELDPNDDD
jgi:peptide deformylase